jgi:hypothetical protein
MNWMRRTLGLLCVIAGTLPSHVLYATSKDGDLWNLQLFTTVLVAAITSFVVFAGCRLLPGGTANRLVVGAIASYAAILALLLVWVGVSGEMDETLMWMPVILLVGIPYLAPLVGMSALGSILVFGDRDRQPDQASPPHPSPAARPPQG